jgi:hypothetical protein
VRPWSQGEEWRMAQITVSKLRGRSHQETMIQDNG